MAREIVTSENKKEYDEKKLNLKPGASINIHDRDIPVDLHPVEERQGNKLHFVNTDKFDEAFKKNKDQYIGPGGTGNIIGERYKGVGEYLKNAKSMRASEAYVKKDGNVIFGDGRHRFAYLRDSGLKKIPMSLDKESERHAKHHGYID